MRFFGFQKKPLFNRGFRREILKVAIFDPPQETPFFDHFWPFWGSPILTTFGPEIDFYAKNPKNDPFWPPRRPPQSKNPGKWPFWRKPGFSSMIWTAKRGGGGGLPRDPPKRPFLAIFAHFGHFWPFLTIFGHFWQIPPILATFWPPECEWKLANSGRKKGENPPWPDFLYLIIGLLGRKFGICAENEDFSAPPQVREMWAISGRNTHYYFIVNYVNNVNKY